MSTSQGNSGDTVLYHAKLEEMSAVRGMYFVGSKLCWVPAGKRASSLRDLYSCGICARDYCRHHNRFDWFWFAVGVSFGAYIEDVQGGRDMYTKRRYSEVTTRASSDAALIRLIFGKSSGYALLCVIVLSGIVSSTSFYIESTVNLDCISLSTMQPFGM